MQVTAFSPLFRHSVGFDRFNQLFEHALQTQKQTDSYPPYNIEKLGDDQYRITMAVAGFKPSDINVTTQDDELHISATAQEKADNVQYLYKGIATRSFTRKFSLTDYIKVTGAAIADGMLTVSLEREVPESRKPRQIAVQVGNTSDTPKAEVIEA